jgi:hypothetical protein
MTKGIKTFIYPVKDLAKAKNPVQRALGRGAPHGRGLLRRLRRRRPAHRFGSPWPQPGDDGPVGYWHVEDIKTSVKALLDAGAEAQQEIKDVGGGKLIASVKDADGNVIGLVQSA